MRSTYSVTRRIIATLHEPRFQTACWVIVYFLTFLLGVLYLINSLNNITSWVSTLAGGTLVVAGVLGIPSSWTGTQWLERAATVALMLGYPVTILLVVDVHLHHGMALFVPTILSHLAIIALSAGRLVKVWRKPWATGKEPVPNVTALRVEDEVRLEAAKSREEELACIKS